MRSALNLWKFVPRLVVHGGAHRFSTFSELGISTVRHASLAQPELRDERWASWSWAFMGFGSATLLYAGANIVECEARPPDKVKVTSYFLKGPKDITTYHITSAPCL